MKNLSAIGTMKNFDRNAAHAVLRTEDKKKPPTDTVQYNDLATSRQKVLGQEIR